jgi:hypothetical protein
MTEIKGGRSANKFLKLQIRKYADLNNLLDLWTLAHGGLVVVKIDKVAI